MASAVLRSAEIDSSINYEGSAAPGVELKGSQSIVQPSANAPA
jgi:hypothetical protein